jgi:putative membrane protein
VGAGAAFAGLSEACMVGSALSVVAGWYLIRRRRVRAHRRLMLAATFLGAAFFVLYVLHTALFGDTSFGGPAPWRAPYQAFLQMHSILASVAGVLGVITLRRALRRRFGAHRRIAPWTATLWLIAAASGLAVFLLLYVVFAPGAASNVLRTLLGG